MLKNALIAEVVEIKTKSILNIEKELFSYNPVFYCLRMSSRSIYINKIVKQLKIHNYNIL